MRGIDLRDRARHRAEGTEDDLLGNEAGPVCAALTERAELVADAHLGQRAGNRVAELHRIGRVAADAHGRRARRRDHDRVASQPAGLQRDLALGRIHRRDDAEDAAPLPLRAVGVLLLGDVAAGHHDDLTRGERRLVVREPSPREDAVTDRDVLESRGHGVVQRAGSGSGLEEGGLVVGAHFDGRARPGLHRDSSGGSVDGGHLTEDRVRLAGSLRRRGLAGGGRTRQDRGDQPGRHVDRSK